jgi:hypothetical protein
MSKVRIERAVLLAASLAAFGLARPAQAQTGLQYFAVTPCRAADTRSGNGGLMTQGALRTFTIKGVCNVSGSAKAVSLNVTAVAPQADGHMVLWPTGGSVPLVSTLNFVAGEPAIANGAIVPVATGTPDLSATYGTCCGGSATTHLIIDITGYFQ